MTHSFLELILGNLDQKRAYNRLMKRVNTLPKDYRFAFKKMQHYLYYADLTGCETLFIDLIELLETSAAEKKPILQVVGEDVAGFCDELVHASAPNALTPRLKLNKEIAEYFHKGETGNAPLN